MSAFFALLSGGLLAVLLFVPFVFLSYRRRGGLGLGRTALWAGFLVYAMALWTYTLLPMPEPDTIVCTEPQLTPFQFVSDIRAYETAGALGLIHNPAFMQVALNVLLFMPLGFFLRALLRRGVLWALLVGCCASLLIEITQVTGVWGIYPCAYRVFDVDDLLANTSGAVLGGVLTALLFALRRRWLPARREQKAREATRGRRVVGMLCDLLSAAVLGVASAVAANAWQLYVMGRTHEDLNPVWAEQTGLWAPFLLLGVVALATGRTVGDHAVRLRYAGQAGGLGLVGRSGRYLAGIGGYQLLTLASPADLVFALVLLAAALATARGRGLPGLATRAQVVDDAPESGVRR